MSLMISNLTKSRTVEIQAIGRFNYRQDRTYIDPTADNADVRCWHILANFPNFDGQGSDRQYAVIVVSHEA